MLKAQISITALKVAEQIKDYLNRSGTESRDSVKTVTCKYAELNKMLKGKKTNTSAALLERAQQVHGSSIYKIDIW